LPTVAAGAFASDVIKNSSPVMKVAISLSLMLVGGGGALVLLHRAIRNSGIAETVIRWRVPLWPVWGIGGYLALVPILLASAAVAGLLQRLLPDVRTPMNPAADLAVGVSGWALILVVLLVCVVVPLLEEVLFRGLLFPALSRRYGVTGGMIVSSVVFAGLHPQLPFGFLPILAIGICLCYLYRASGSLLACVIAHGLNNGFAMVGSYLALSAIRL
ncbi:MAG: CPBP family intramembrane metalloprotease, partial [Armatimonadetes bacterium]|nr:CPBP family intramembrane metalloprotease [Armatimonadota bacterium]